MSKFLAYSFLYDDATDLKCDFELLSDEIAGMIGFLRSLLDDVDRRAGAELDSDLSKIIELLYHINPSLRTRVTVTQEELDWLYGKTMRLKDAVGDGHPVKGGGERMTFLIPQGCTQAAESHVIRSRCKMLVRLLSRYQQQGNQVPDLLFDFVNLYAGYFHFLALWFNKNHGVEEEPFTSRVY
jgi:cob(I)alamin adenosyltransferase